MSDDPIVAEVRAQRATLVAEAGGTLEALVLLLKQREREAGRVAVSLPSPTPTSTSPAS